MQAMKTVLCGLAAAVLAAAVLGFGVCLAASTTVLDSNFVTAEMNRTDIPQLFADEARKLVPTGADFLLPVIDEAATDLEPWAREQAALVVQAAYDFINERRDFRVVLSLQEPKEYLVARVAEALQSNLLPGLPQVPADQMDAFLLVIEREVDARIPDLLVIDESFVGEDVMQPLRDAQRYAGYVRTGLRLLPAVALIAVLLIAFMQRRSLRLAGRYVGFGSVAGGAAAVVLALALRSALPAGIAASVPAPIATAVPGFVDRASQPLLLYGILLLVAGIGLVLLSLRPRPVEL
jgi:hypothetical protein